MPSGVLSWRCRYVFYFSAGGGFLKNFPSRPILSLRKHFPETPRRRLDESIGLCAVAGRARVLARREQVHDFTQADAGLGLP